MKIVKEGKWNLPWSAEMSCPTCEALLLVEEADVKPIEYSNTGYCCSCAICAKSIVIPDKDLPLRIKEAIGKKRKHYSSGSAWD